MEVDVRTEQERELLGWIEQVGTVAARSVAATTATSLARKSRREGLDVIKADTRLPSREATKRVHLVRANPKAGQEISAAIVSSVYQVREALLNPRQTGHPGRPRYSDSKRAKKARTKRRAQGAKAPRSGGVNTKGRTIEGAWIGKAKRGKAKKGNVLQLRDNGAVARVFRDWQPSLETLNRKLNASTGDWAEEYGKALQRRINRTRPGVAAPSVTAGR